MEGCMDHIHLALKVSKPKVTLVIIFLLPLRPWWQTNLILYYDKEYTRYGVTRYGVVRYTFIRRFLHRTVTTQG
jgi:hypothetical protein